MLTLRTSRARTTSDTFERGGRLFVTDYRLNQPDAEGGLYTIDLGVCSGQQLQ